MTGTELKTMAAAHTVPPIASTSTVASARICSRGCSGSGVSGVLPLTQVALLGKQEDSHDYRSPDVNQRLLPHPQLENAAQADLFRKQLVNQMQLIPERAGSPAGGGSSP